MFLFAGGAELSVGDVADRAAPLAFSATYRRTSDRAAELRRAKYVGERDFPGKRYLDWELEDPAGMGIDAVRPIRDEIERRVAVLIGELIAR